MGKMSDHELLSPEYSGSGSDNVLLRGGVAIRMSWYALFGKINSRGDVYSELESIDSEIFGESLKNL